MLVRLSMLAYFPSFCYFLSVAALIPIPVPQMNATVLNFDDVATKHGFANVPSPYSHLNFFLFSIFNPRDPALSKLITENDLNCAVSSPNALLGSRVAGRALPASFGIADASSMVANGLQAHFTLLSFYIKPMDAPPPGVGIYVRGYSHVQEPVEWHVDFPSGYHLPLLVNLAKFSHFSWEQLYRVEIWATFGEDALDWEFCLDDLEILFEARLAQRLQAQNRA